MNRSIMETPGLTTIESSLARGLVATAPLPTISDSLPDDVKVPIRSSSDVITARQQGRALAALAGFSASQLTIIATAISEIARNIVEYAVAGEVTIALF